MINQGTAPIPIENDAMNISTPETARSGTHSRKMAWPCFRILKSVVDGLQNMKEKYSYFDYLGYKLIRTLRKNEVPARKHPRNVPDEDT